jgi:hypothetical protein
MAQEKEEGRRRIGWGELERRALATGYKGTEAKRKTTVVAFTEQAR